MEEATKTYDPDRCDESERNLKEWLTGWDVLDR